MSDNRQIAARILGLIAGQGELSDVAGMLEVAESALRMSVDETTPYPTFDVIMAVVHHYGVDPSWLITGAYDASSHRAALQASAIDLPTVINDVVSSLRPTPPTNLRIVH